MQQIARIEQLECQFLMTRIQLRSHSWKGLTRLEFRPSDSSDILDFIYNNRITKIKLLILQYALFIYVK